MKKVILALVAVMTMTAAQAQDGNRQRGERRQFDRTEMLKNRTDEVAKKYGLTKEQADKLLELNTKYADKMGGRMGGPRGRRPGARPGGFGGGQNGGQRPELTEEQKQQMEAARKQREEAMKQYDEELQKIMTPEQYEAYKKDQAQRRQEGARRGGPRGE